MIIHFSKDVPANLLEKYCDDNFARSFVDLNYIVVVTGSKIREVTDNLKKFVLEQFEFDSDLQLGSLDYRSKIGIQLTSVEINNLNTVLCYGPCSVESRDQIMKVAEKISELGLTTIRGGCYKPRTSPYSFAGLEKEGLELLSEVRSKYGLKVITEVRDVSHVTEVIESADIVQIGTKAMYNWDLLSACGEARKPVLLKRGFGSTLQEFVQAAEFILVKGNSDVILCERGIRTFEDKTRFTLDLGGVAFLKRHTNLPVFVDPSHGMGHSYGVPDLARAAAAMGVEGILIEVHPNPELALSDAAQQIDLVGLESLTNRLKKVCSAVDRQVI